MAQLLKFSRKLKAPKNSTAQTYTHNPTSFPTTLQQGSTASTPGSGAVSPTNRETGPKKSDKVQRDLWQEALDKLDEKKKLALNLRFDENGQVQPCVTDAIQSVVTSIEVSFEEYRNGGWKITDRNGKVIFDLRENGKKILKFALRSKAIIDSGVKLDPTGYSSSAWAIISLGLQFVQNDQDGMSAVFDASALLADVLHRYANIEANYRDQDVPDVTELEDRLCSSYEAILNYVAMVEEKRCEGFLGRAWYSLYSLSEQPLQLLKDSILSADNATEQWRQLIEHEYRLKESETINKKVDEACGKLDRMLDGLNQNLMATNRGNQLLEMILVHLESKGDVKQMSTFLHQRVAEGLDLPTITKAVDNNDERKQEDHDSHLDNEENLDQLLREVFVELREFNQDSKRHQRMIEKLPEMRPYKTKNLNLLRTDKIMRWIESDASQLLWINGNSVIGRYDFNSMFVVPLLLFGESNFEQVLILRHFCGDNPSLKTNNYRTLVQALVFQTLKQRPRVFRGRIPSITRNETDDITKLWKLFLECVREVHADCSFIIIDCIDSLQDANTPEGSSERELILQNLDALVKDRGMLIKILLTSSLRPELSASSLTPELSFSSLRPELLASTEDQSPGPAPRRRLSLAIIQNELPLVPQKLIEIQERRCRSLSFLQLCMIYPENSVIYTFNDGQLQAFIVDQLSGMEERSSDTYNALQVRAWSVDHNGRYFTKRYHDFLISQFPAERPITSLKYIPSGHLADEPEQRMKLIARGRRYWELGSGIHYQQVVKNGESIRIVIDQRSRPLKPPSIQELEDEFQVVSHHGLKPRILMICPATIASYVLGDGKWDTVNIDEVLDVTFQYDLFQQLILPKEEKETLFRLVLSQRNGLTILLHGGPGTGKTFTATCIAEKIKRPLLLGSVEIGRSIADVEQSLSQSFELAERWGAILLLEDVDSLLARRQAGQSSDLAATFTKVIQAIDKCSGVLFLTTCRVGVLDEAILSRIDYTVQYKPLSNKTLNEFWNMALLDESEDPITLDILDNLKEWEQLDGYEYLNGRDIQAIVLTARQMASVQGKLLGVRELEPILKARIDFARYMIRVRGGHTANEEAQRMRYRSDEPGKVDWD